MKNFHLFLLFLLPFYLSGQDESWWVYSDLSGAFDGIDIVEAPDSGLYVLGHQRTFSPPYTGHPIEGEFSIGNIFIKLDNSFDQVFEKQFFNSALRYDPSIFFKLNPAGKLFIPHIQYVGLVFCVSQNIIETYRLGIITIEEERGDLDIHQAISNEDGDCEHLQILGCFAGSDSILVIVNDPKRSRLGNPYEYQYRWFDTQGNLLSNTTQAYNPIRVLSSGMQYESDDQLMRTRDGDFLLVCYDSLRHDMVILNIDGKGNVNSKHYIGSDLFPLGFTGFSKYMTDNQYDLLFAFNADRHGKDYIIKYNENFQKLWTREMPWTILDMDTLPGREGYIALFRTFSATDNGFVVGIIDKTGTLTNIKSYGTTDYRATQLSLVGDDAFAVVGMITRDIVGSTYGDPYARLFVMKDFIDNLIPVGVSEVSESVHCTVFPNPTTGFLSVSTSEEFGEAVRYVISDGMGRQVSTADFEAPTASSFTTDVSNLTLGLYILQIVNEHGMVLTTKFVKM
jgi:hypothetical protein